MTEFPMDIAPDGPQEGRIMRACSLLSRRMPRASGVRGVIEMCVGGILIGTGTVATLGLEHLEAPTPAGRIVAGISAAGMVLGIVGAAEVTTATAPNEQAQVALEHQDLI